jgi:transposase
MTFSVDLKVRAVNLYLKHVRSLRRTANMLDISKSSVQRWLCMPWLHRKLPKQKCMAFKRDVQQQIAELVSANPFIAASEIVSCLRLKQHQRTVCRLRRKLGFTRKKAFKEVVQRPGLDEQRADFARNIVAMNPDTVISVDESGFYMDMKPSFGYSRRGQRLHAMKHPNYRDKWTLLMAVGTKGVIHWELFKGACTSAIFAAFIAQIAIHRNDQQHHVLMDNASIHKTLAVRNAFAAANLNALFLPPYTPCFQPIELVFSCVKRAYRKMCVQKHADGVIPSVHQRVAASIQAATSAHQLPNQFRHCWKLALEASPTTA